MHSTQRHACTARCGAPEVSKQLIVALVAKGLHPVAVGQGSSDDLVNPDGHALAVFHQIAEHLTGDLRQERGLTLRIDSAAVRLCYC